MATLALLCTDGSELSIQALAAGLRVLAPVDRTIVITVTGPVDPTLVTGVSGFGGGVVSAEQYEGQRAALAATAEQVVRDTVAALGLEHAETMVVEGDPGQALCDVAAETGASVLVAGSHGRGGLKRALLGSVSDHLVRHAPCPVVITRPE